MKSTPATYFSDVERCVDAILDKVGKRIVFGMPLGLGKPNHLANALYERAKRDASISLRIMTALSLAVPKGNSDLERRFLEPFTQRVWGNYPALSYLDDLSAGKLPPNVEVSEFFMKAGVFLDNPIEQQNYISSNYTHIARDMLANGQAIGTQDSRIVVLGDVDGDGDLDAFVGTPEAAWVRDNAWRFGYVVSYPEGMEAVTGYVWEPWHIRYVGEDVAREIRESGLTPGEFLARR